MHCRPIKFRNFILLFLDESNRWAEATEHAQVGVLKFPHLPEFRFHLGNLFGKQVS
jgi:hypothetical protein